LLAQVSSQLGQGLGRCLSEPIWDAKSASVSEANKKRRKEKINKILNIINFEFYYFYILPFLTVVSAHAKMNMNE